MPGHRLLDEAAVDQGEEREGRVAQPAEAVVPKFYPPPASPAATSTSAPRRSRRSRRISQRLQRHQRTADDRAHGPLIAAAAKPFAPERLCLPQRSLFESIASGTGRCDSPWLGRRGWSLRPRSRTPRPWSDPCRGSRPASAARSCRARRSQAAPGRGLSRLTQGTSVPKPKRIATPSAFSRGRGLPRTSRTTSDAWPRGGMKSTIATVPFAVSKRVSRMSVLSR